MTTMTDDLRETEIGGGSNEELPMVSGGGLSMLVKSEIDMQIATAKRYRRSVHQAVALAETMATLDPDTAASCFYKLKRRGKDGQDNVIEGPSVRLLEIFASAWGNIRFGARIIDMGDKFITAQGVAHDLETNAATQIEIQRRITTSTGRRYGDDMIAVTGNAACAIAMRNALLKVIPRVYVEKVFRRCKKVAVGDAKTLVQRRAELLADLNGKMGIGLDRILPALGRASVNDIDLNDLETLHGYRTAIRDGEAKIDDVFPDPKTIPAQAAAEPAKDKAAALAGKINGVTTAAQLPAPAAVPAPAPAAAKQPEPTPQQQPGEPAPEQKPADPEDAKQEDPPLDDSQAAEILIREAVEGTWDEASGNIHAALEKKGIARRKLREELIQKYATKLGYSNPNLMTVDQRVDLLTAINEDRIDRTKNAIRE